MTTTMMSWDLFEDLRAAQDELLQAARGRGWQPGQQRYYSDAGTAVWRRRSTYPNAMTPTW